MCGLIYLHTSAIPNGARVTKKIRKMYEAQKSRGVSGFGFVALNTADASVKAIRRRTQEKEIFDAMEAVDANALLFHHRFPTSTGNFKEASHPITVRHAERLGKDRVFYFIHNGVIQNPSQLRAEHEKLGYVYSTVIKKTTKHETRDNVYTSTNEDFNDSEALAVDFVETFTGNQTDMRAMGSIAFIAIEAIGGKAVALHYGRNIQNPLIREERGGGAFVLRSESGNKSADDIPAHVLHTLDYQTGETTTREFIVGKPIAYSPQVGYNWHDVRGYDSKKFMEEEPVDYGVARTAWREYKDTGSIMDNSLSELFAEGMTLEEIQNEAQAELSSLEDIFYTAGEEGSVLLEDMASRQAEKLEKWLEVLPEMYAEQTGEPVTADKIPF